MNAMLRSLFVVGLLVVVIGCRGGIEQFDRAPVTVRVLCKGEPLALARVAFNPVWTDKSALTGKQGLGITDIDGSFTISTYEDSDGAVIGKHSVRVWLDEAVCDCVVGDTIEVEQVDVKGGQEHHFEIVLKEATKRDQQMQVAQFQEDLDE